VECLIFIRGGTLGWGKRVGGEGTDVTREVLVLKERGTPIQWLIGGECVFEGKGAEEGGGGGRPGSPGHTSH